MRRIVGVLLMAVLAATMPGTAAAHSFTVVLVGPFSGPGAARAKQMLDGFRLATREQDAHADEEADGHLGGLDVYIVPRDPSGSTRGLPKTRGATGAKAGEAAFIVGLIPCVEMLPALRRGTTPRAPFVGSVGSAKPLAGRAPWRLAGTAPANRRFVKTFKAAFGYAPTPAAAQGYDAARLIAAVVRALGEELTNRQALARELDRAAFKSVRGHFAFTGSRGSRGGIYLVGALKPAANARPAACR
jgi:ABC-type branched-subunit amino acid transport system substrate-binding protein